MTNNNSLPAYFPDSSSLDKNNNYLKIMSKQYLNQNKMQVLKSVWNYDSFRENQAEAIEDLISLKKDILFLGTDLSEEVLQPELTPLLWE